MKDNTKIVASFEKSINQLHELICDQLLDADENKEILIETAIGKLGGLTHAIRSIITATTKETKPT